MGNHPRIAKLPLVGSTAYREYLAKLEIQLNRPLNANEKHSLLQIARQQQSTRVDKHGKTVEAPSLDRRSGTSAAKAFKVKGEVYKYKSIRVMRPSGAGKVR